MVLADVKGQQRAISILQGYIRAKRLAGGYLFSGPQGVGKFMTARILAKLLNCATGTLDACDTCASCRKIDAGQHPDIHILFEEESEIKIDSIRQLKKDASLRPYEARMSVFIINDAHRLTVEASNALLKILEEPPQDSIIILVTDKPSLLLKTVVSRCKAVKFQAIHRSALEEILKKEHGMHADMAHYLAYYTEGRIGYALALKGKGLEDKNTVIDALALRPVPDVRQLSLQKRETVRAYLNILATWFRDIYFVKTGMPHTEIINRDRLDEVLNVMGRYSFLELDEIIQAISHGINQLDQNINVRLMLHNLGAHIWKA